MAILLDKHLIVEAPALETPTANVGAERQPAGEWSHLGRRDLRHPKSVSVRGLVKRQG